MITRYDIHTSVFWAFAARKRLWLHDVDSGGKQREAGAEMGKKTATATGTTRDARASGASVPKGSAGVDRLLDMHEVAGALAISHGSVKGLVATGKLPSAKLGRRRLIRRSDLGKFIAGLEA